MKEYATLFNYSKHNFRQKLEDNYLHFPKRTRNPEDYRYIWENHKGVKRCSYWEMTRYFDTAAELESWTKEQMTDDFWAYTVNEGGILTSFSLNCESNAIVVMVEKGVVRARANR